MEPGANTGPRLTPVQTQLIAAAFEEAAHDGAVVEPDQVERIAAGLLGGVLTDGMLDTIIDATDGKDGIDVRIAAGGNAPRSGFLAPPVVPGEDLHATHDTP